jgi:hypothetical protein
VQKPLAESKRRAAGGDTIQGIFGVHPFVADWAAKVRTSRKDFPSIEVVSNYCNRGAAFQP